MPGDDTGEGGTANFAVENSTNKTRGRLRRRRRHHLRQKRLALRLGAIALHGRRKTLKDAVLEGGDDGVVNVALAADRRRVGEFIRSSPDGFQHLLAAGSWARAARDC